MSYPRLLSWYSEAGPVTKTRYPRLHIWKQDRGCWRVLATDDGGDTRETGPWFRTKAEALAYMDGPLIDDSWRSMLPTSCTQCATHSEYADLLPGDLCRACYVPVGTQS